MKKGKVTACLLAGCMLIGCLTGCGKNGEPEKEKTPSKTETSANVQDRPRAKIAFEPEYIELKTDQGKSFDYVMDFCIAGSDMFFSGSYQTGEKETVMDENNEPMLDENGKPIEYDITKEGMFHMNLDTREIMPVESQEAEKPEGLEMERYTQGMCAAPDGTLWMLEHINYYSFDLPENFDEATQDKYEYYVPGESYVAMTHIAADGTSLGEVRLELPEEISPQSFLVDTQNHIYCGDWQAVCIFDETGKLLNTLELQEGGELIQISPDVFGIQTYSMDSEGQVLKLLNPETQEFDTELKLPAGAGTLYPATNDYDYLYQVGDSIYGYRKDTEAGERLFSWLECDLNTDSMDGLEFLSDGRVVGLENNFGEEERTTKLVILNPVDASTIPEKQELVLGCLSLGYDLRPLVIDFNRTHDDVRIVVRNYRELIGDGTFEEALQKMNTEILSGNAPDLICSDGLPMDLYAAKGIFLDLWPFIDKDPELGRDTLMEHFFDALSTDGKLYAITSCFAIQTAGCKASLTGDRDSWTLQEMQETLNKLEPGATFFGELDTKDGMLTNCISFNMASYLDWANKTCAFDTPEFVSVLEFANTFHDPLKPEDYQNINFNEMESEYSRINSGKQLMSTSYISDFTEVQIQNAYHGGEVNFIGYPSDQGNGSCFQANTLISISASCQYPELAWSFVRELLKEENQMSVPGFPTNKAAFDADAKKAMTPVYYTDPETGEKVESSNMGIGIGDDFELEIYACSQEEYDTLMDLYQRCSTIYVTNLDIMKLINEEAGPYFAGQKTAEETAKLIQNRVGLYMMEQG